MLFYQGTCYHPDDTCYCSGLRAVGTDLYFGVRCIDCINGPLSKINTIGTPISQDIGFTDSVISITFDNTFLYTSSIGYLNSSIQYEKFDLVTYERTTLYSSIDEEIIGQGMVLANKNNFIYTSYNYDIYRFNTGEAFNQVLYYDFEHSIITQDMIFVEDDLYCIRGGQLLKLSRE